MMLSEMYLESMLRNCEDEYEVRSTLSDAGIDYEDVSDERGRLTLHCWNEKGTLLAITLDNGRASVREINP